MDYFVHMRILTNKEIEPMVEWLNQNIGKQKEDWVFGLYFNKDTGLIDTTDKFSFKREEDLVKFILRWL